MLNSNRTCVGHGWDAWCARMRLHACPTPQVFLKPEILNYKLQIKSATMPPNDLRKKKQKNKKQKQIFRAVVKEAQVLVAFETFFFNFALNFWVFETFKKK